MAVKLSSKAKKRIGLSFIFLIVFVICIVVRFKQIELDKQYNEENEKYEQLQKNIMDEEKRSKLLQREKDYRTTDRYFEDVAREILGLVYEDEIIFESGDK